MNASYSYSSKIESGRVSVKVRGRFLCAPGERTFSGVKVPKSPGSGKA